MKTQLGKEIKKDFFITYHHDDELAARWIADILLKAPYSLFLESWNFLPGNLPLEKINYMLTRAQFAVVLVSRHLLRVGVEAATWQPVTNKYPLKETSPLLLLRIDSCDVEQALGTVAFTDLYKCNPGEAANQLLKAAAAAPDASDEGKRETSPVTPTTRPEILELRKKELEISLSQTVNHNYHMTLDLETEVEKEVEVKDETYGRIEKRKQQVWEALSLERVLTDENHYLLVNPSGMGKTTFLTYAAGELLDRTKEYPFVPLLTTCITLNQRSSCIGDFIANQVESHYKNTKTVIVNENWENLCILIDALDQAMDVSDILSSLLLPNRYTHFKNAKIILSSRQNTAEKVKEGFLKIRLKLPVEHEVRNYLGKENYKKMAGHIQASRELVTVPVLLKMLKVIIAKGGDTSAIENRTGLYNEFTKILMDMERNKPRYWQYSLEVHHFIYNELEQTLEKIAFFSLAENKILEIEKETLVTYCGSPEKQEALLNIGILLELFEDQEQKMVFRHQSFQAYFAARYVYYRRPDLFKEITKDIRFFYSDVWYEVMRFFVGMEKDPEKAGRIIDYIVNNDLSSKPVQWNIKRLKEYTLAEALRLIFTFFLISETRLNNDLLKIKYESLRDLLNTNYHFWNFFISNIDKFNKGNDEQRRSISIIFEPLLNNEAIWVQIAATEVFGEIGTSKDVHLIEPMLKKNNWLFRKIAIEAIEKIFTKKDIHLLKPLLKDSNIYVRTAAENALRKIGIDEYNPLQKSGVKDEVNNVRNVSVEAFREIETNENISNSELLLGNKNEDVRNQGCRRLGMIGTLNHISLLEKLLKDDHNNIDATKAIESILKRSATGLRLSIPEPAVGLKYGETRTIQLQNFILPRIPPLHILHISDIHYSEEDNPSITRIFHEFLMDIKKWQEQTHNEPIHAICLTGDIAYSGQKYQYASIQKRINEILQVSGCSKDNIFVIPGNHDVHEYNNFPEECQKIMDNAVKDETCIDRILSDFEKYRPFHDKFTHYYEYVETSGFTNSLPETRGENPKPWYSRRLKDFPVRIIGLNSALFCIKPYSERDKIRMGKRQLEEAYFHEKSMVREDQELVLLLTHHPADWLREAEKEEYETMMGRYKVVNLYGHIHRLKLELRSTYSGSTYILIGTGSIYGERGTKDINTYHIMTLDFEKQDIHIWGRRWEPGDGCWTAFADTTTNFFPFPQKKT